MWLTASSGPVGHAFHLDFTKALNTWRLDLFTVKCFKVEKVTQLARLADSFSTSKSSLSIKLEAIVGIIKKASKQKSSADTGPCPSFSGIAMDDNHVFRIG